MTTTQWTHLSALCGKISINKKGNKMKLKKLFNAAAIAILFSGCGTLLLETNVKMTKSVWLKPAEKEKQSIYVSLKNISQENLEILPMLKSRLEEKNYVLVENSNGADYILMINILFANNLKEAYAIKNAAGVGITTGIIAAASSSNTRDSLLIGATAALATGLVTKALEDKTYRAVVDVTVEEKREDAEALSEVMGQGYKTHQTRVLAEAVQTHLKLEEALPVLSDKVATQISNIF